MKTECLYIVFYIVQIMTSGNLSPEVAKIKNLQMTQQKEK